MLWRSALHADSAVICALGSAVPNSLRALRPLRSNKGTEHDETGEARRDPFFCFTGEQIHKDDQTDAASQDDLGRDGVVVNRW